MTTPTQDLLTPGLTARVLASLKHLHTLHGPCDEGTCPHAAVITELENVLFTEPPRAEWPGKSTLLQKLRARAALQLANQEQP